MAKTSLESAQKSLANIYRHGGQDALFLEELRTDINNLLRFIAHSFCLKEPGQTIELPRGWSLHVTSHCNIHTHGYDERKHPKPVTLVLQKWSKQRHEYRDGSEGLTQVWSCGLSNKPPKYGWMTREEVFELADEIQSGWLDEVAEKLSVFRAENLDLTVVRFFTNID